MAPRLRRWTLIVVAGSLLATWLLLPTGRPIFSGSSDGQEWDGTSLQGRRRAVLEARWRTQYEIERRRQVAAFEQLARSAAARGEDPVVLAPDGPSSLVRRPVQSYLSALWGKFPSRDPRLMTLVALNGQWTWQFELTGAERNDSLCVAYVDGIGRTNWNEGRMNWSVGKCALRERFGPSGVSWAKWLDATWYVPVDLTRGAYMGYASTAEIPRPWFGAVPLSGGFWDNWAPGNDPSRALVACAAGNQGSCRKTFGLDVTDTAWSGGRTISFYSRMMRYDTRGSLPGAIYRDLGEEGFAKLWHTDTTIAAGYEQISGKSIDGLLQRIAFTMVGPRPKDIGLSPLGWAGALIWLALLGAWAALRLRERRIGW
jgi:hypothetical protein